MGIIDKMATALTDENDHREMYVVVFNHVVIIVPLLVPTLVLHWVLPQIRSDKPDIWEVLLIGVLRFIELLPAVMVVLLMLNVSKVLVVRLCTKPQHPPR